MHRAIQYQKTLQTIQFKKWANDVNRNLSQRYSERPVSTGDVPNGSVIWESKPKPEQEAVSVIRVALAGKELQELARCAVQVRITTWSSCCGNFSGSSNHGTVIPLLGTHSERPERTQKQLAYKSDRGTHNTPEKHTRPPKVSGHFKYDAHTVPLVSKRNDTPTDTTAWTHPSTLC